MADGNLVFAVTRDNRKHIVNYTLEELEKRVDPDEFLQPSMKCGIPFPAAFHVFQTI